jgi:hypothetical protein
MQVIWFFVARGQFFLVQLASWSSLHNPAYYIFWVWLFYIIANLFVFKAYKQIIINKIIAI